MGLLEDGGNFLIREGTKTVARGFPARWIWAQISPHHCLALHCRHVALSSDPSALKWES